VTAPPATGTPRLLAEADRVTGDLERQRRLWDRGFTRRSFLAGSGMVAAASLGSQLVTTRHAFAAPGTGSGKTLVSVFLRGGLDGVATVVPVDPIYQQNRGRIAIPESTLLPLDSRFGLHPSCAPLQSLWNSRQLAFVHAVGPLDANRDHFACQAQIERGDDSSAAGSGWLERVLEVDGPGTTFRAVAEGPSVPASLRGAVGAVAMTGISSLKFDNPSPKISDALSALYTGLDNPLESLMATTVRAVADAVPIQATPPAPAPGARYASDSFGSALADIARLVKANAGLRVATVDVGGWDLHSAAGTVDAGAMTSHLADISKSLYAFSVDLGSRLGDVTVVTMSEFGRRLEVNSGGGTDHGHGGLMMVLGGMVAGGNVYGGWPGLSELDHGDVQTVNDYRDVLGEAAQKTLNLGDLTTVFPNYRVAPLGIMR